MFYKLNVGNSPEFLRDLIPPSVGETNNYNLRNSHNISQTTNRLSTIRAASNCSFSNLSELTCPQLSHTSGEYSKIGLMKVK
jgi:hypothetical protein